jgi:uncharacterized protein (TIRG00374 family)
LVWLKSIARFAILIAISAVSLAIAARGVHLDELGTRLAQIKLMSLFGPLAGVAGMFLLKALRWQRLLDHVKPVGFAKLLHVSFIGFAANNVLPFRGGDLVRAYLLDRYAAVPTPTALATVALDRAFEVLSLLTIFLLLVMLAPMPSWISQAMLAIGAILVAVVVALMALRNPPRRLLKIVRLLARPLPLRVTGVFAETHQRFRMGLGAINGATGALVPCLLALFESGMSAIVIYSSLRIVGVELSVLGVMTTLIAMNVAVLIPAAPGNIGVFEFVVAATLQNFAVDKATALGGAILLHAISVVPASIVGFGLLLRDRSNGDAKSRS